MKGCGTYGVETDVGEQDRGPGEQTSDTGKVDEVVEDNRRRGAARHVRKESEHGRDDATKRINQLLILSAGHYEEVAHRQ